MSWKEISDKDSRLNALLSAVWLIKLQVFSWCPFGFFSSLIVLTIARKTWLFIPWFLTFKNSAYGKILVCVLENGPNFEVQKSFKAFEASDRMIGSRKSFLMFATCLKMLSARKRSMAQFPIGVDNSGTPAMKSQNIKQNQQHFYQK